MTFLYVILAILLFGLLVGIHEGGHFLAAKACGVRVEEFALGMGPALWKKQKGETLYALRLIPFGGYCAMAGEDEASDDPRAFTSQPPWKRIIILCAGAFMNFLLGFLMAKKTHLKTCLNNYLKTIHFWFSLLANGQKKLPTSFIK